MEKKKAAGGGSPQVVILADDLTGALDTGVKFACEGTRVRVGLFEDPNAYAPDASVWVLDAETRHLSPGEAYDRTFRLARRAAEQGAQHLYIKTDSALRGNVAAAVLAGLAAMECGFAAFAPAYPDLGRVTRSGVQLTDGLPVQFSGYGRDPLNPVRLSRVKELFAAWDVSVQEVPVGARLEEIPAGKTVAVFDAETNGDLQAIAGYLREMDLLRVTAGCAGFAQALGPFLGTGGPKHAVPGADGPLLVLCGSLHPASHAQLAFGERRSFVRRTCPLSVLAEDPCLAGSAGRAWLEELRVHLGAGRSVLLDTGRPGEAVRGPGAESGEKVAERLGKLLLLLLALPEVENHTPLVIGGDTLEGFVRLLKAPGICLEGEALPGVAAFTLRVGDKRLRMLSKSGGMGGEALLDSLAGGTDQDKGG